MEQTEREPTESELLLLANWAHELGCTFYHEQRDLRRAELEAWALRELEIRDNLGHLSPKHPRVRAVWAWNFYAGFRFSEQETYDFETPTAEVGDYRPAIDAQAQEEGQQP
jgi:hypothetical protein